MSKSPECFIGGTSVDEVREAEVAVGIPFPAEYVDFLLEFGGGIVGFGLPVFGVLPHPFLGRSGTVVQATAHARRDAFLGVDEWIVISDDGTGSPIGLSEDGMVWISDHDEGAVWLVGERFWDFVGALLDRRLPRLRRATR